MTFEKTILRVIMLSAVMLGVVMLNIVILSVLAPLKCSIAAASCAWNTTSVTRKLNKILPDL
jgi:hypothetical protein